jgi:hypothetical protein
MDVEIISSSEVISAHCVQACARDSGVDEESAELGECFFVVRVVDVVVVWARVEHLQRARVLWSGVEHLQWAGVLWSGVEHLQWAGVLWSGVEHLQWAEWEHLQWAEWEHLQWGLKVLRGQRDVKECTSAGGKVIR